MRFQVRLTKEIEVVARALVASPWQIYKWRERGIPSAWQLKILDAYKAIKPFQDMPNPLPSQLDGAAE